MDVEEHKETIKSALADCEKWREHYKLAQATPNQIHFYNLFTAAVRELKNHLACIEDVDQTYMKGQQWKKM